MLFIAEIGLNHNGSEGLMYELIKQARQAGADIAKFQLGWRCQTGEINCMDAGLIGKLKRWCDYFEIELMFSIISEEALSMIKPFNLKRYKIASRTIQDNIDLARRIIDEGKETFVSLGMWNSVSPPFLKTDTIKYLYCKAKYPSEPIDFYDFPKEFGKTAYEGFSDHSIGIEMALLAVARGAKIIEKHFTLDKSDTVIRDHALSATPEEFRLLVNLGRDLGKKVAMGI
jgi:sialic acid synthase SpsE